MRLGGLICHIEKECPSLNVAMLQELREKKLEFPRKLESLTKESVKNDFSQHMNSTAQSSGGVLLTTKPDPFLFRKNEFPTLGATKQASSATQDENKAPAIWGEGKLEIKAPEARKFTAGQLKALTKPGIRETYESIDPHDPANPGFNAARYYCEYSEAFVCPRERCG